MTPNTNHPQWLTVFATSPRITSGESERLNDIISTLEKHERLEELCREGVLPAISTLANQSEKKGNYRLANSYRALRDILSALCKESDETNE